MSKKRMTKEVKDQTGTTRMNPKRENKPEPAANGIEPAMPEWFGQDEYEKWEELSADLKEAGVLSSDIREAMISYCTSYGLWIQYYRQLQEEGSLTVGPKGDSKVHPLLPEMNKQRAIMNKLLNEFGLTPSAKAKVVPVKVDEPEDPFADIVAKLTGGAE